MNSRKISLNEAKVWSEGVVSGKTYIDEKEFDALEVIVDGEYGDKILKVNCRMYRVEEGSGIFVLDNVEYSANPGDLFVIYQGTHWKYAGKMKLFEVTFK
jgi:mannose-6-phosphate isomerase-like protein (cupin superfamily)